MSKKDKFLYIFLIIITFGLILLYWRKYRQIKPKKELSISTKISFKLEDLIDSLGSKENIKSIKSSNQIVKIAINDNSLVKIDEVKNLKGISGVVNNTTQISLVVGNSAPTIQKELENKLQKS
ncbi:glucose/sucrose specific PTS system IIB component [[Mycoplasma] mobile]|uniref:Putative glucose/sucrose specific PTS system IIB component n=1 Tax=Mycoplasma mobile (strain ATCC 43663 / 163K / NCTC 11711) TaxID=267748 RepID=Q6KHE4_MYCM1|nr:glucose/sucrose specific PTS system IIB component [[Mycoplasma] mobile]AAT27986.1 putative glucose/sucrose specific PTS system IIB component [Mycoplasma mobile 163K]